MVDSNMQSRGTLKIPANKNGVDIKSYSPDNQMIRAGTVQLNKISCYLSDLSNKATAELLIAPDNITDIHGGDPTSWVDTIKDIRDIKDYHGLDGIQIFDSTERELHSLESLKVIYDLSEDEIEIPPSYEQELAEQIKIAFARAYFSRKTVTTGLFMATKPLALGRNIYASPEEEEDRRLLRVEKIFNDLAHTIEHGGNVPANDDGYYYTCTEPGNESNFAYSITETIGKIGYALVHKERDIYANALPVALAIHP